MLIARAWTKEKKIKICILSCEPKVPVFSQICTLYGLEKLLKIEKKKSFVQAVENIISKKCAKFEEDRLITFWEIVTTDFKIRVSRKKRLNFYIQIRHEIFFFLTYIKSSIPAPYSRIF